MFYVSQQATPLGEVMLFSDGEALTRLCLGPAQTRHASWGENVQEQPNLAIFRQVRYWLDMYFNQARPEVSFPLSPQGTLFQQHVWRHVQNIPYGQTQTYGAIADHITIETGHRVSAQAVGQAVGHNPLLLVIPCHRVIGCHGRLTGYAAGLDIKQRLLIHEGASFRSLIEGKGFGMVFSS